MNLCRQTPVGDGDEARLAAIRDAVPHARLIADANEAWRDGPLLLDRDRVPGLTYASDKMFPASPEL